ncbi:TetR/AcrR family transcriptional regulator [Photobacterium sp. MCCC 1A19761]|uniref:TetR/AcrR family transcriptional regulator n=1 Tax=Photobacterium sp. MCCC 1A19761 TaxID=3115000 RepID=UPI00307F8C47
MARKTRSETMAETRQKLLSTGRELFGTVGYAETVMDDLTAKVGLTRGALYHHFGDKKGLFLAVLQALDADMDARLADISEQASDPWQAFQRRCRAYLEMATEPEVQRIMLRDAASVLAAEQLQAMQLNCVASIAGMLDAMMQQGLIPPASPQMLARFINGGLTETALWIAHSEDAPTALTEALAGLEVWLAGLVAARAASLSVPE